MQAPADHAVENVSLTPWELAVVQFGEHFMDRVPELVLIEAQIHRVPFLEDLHAEVECQVVAIE